MLLSALTLLNYLASHRIVITAIISDICFFSSRRWIFVPFLEKGASIRGIIGSTLHSNLNSDTNELQNIHLKRHHKLHKLRVYSCTFMRWVSRPVAGSAEAAADKIVEGLTYEKTFSSLISLTDAPSHAADPVDDSAGLHEGLVASSLPQLPTPITAALVSTLGLCRHWPPDNIKSPSSPRVARRFSSRKPWYAFQATLLSTVSW